MVFLPVAPAEHQRSSANFRGVGFDAHAEKRLSDVMASEPLHVLFIQIVVTCFSLEPSNSSLVFLSF